MMTLLETAACSSTLIVDQVSIEVLCVSGPMRSSAWKVSHVLMDSKSRREGWLEQQLALSRIEWK